MRVAAEAHALLAGLGTMAVVLLGEAITTRTFHVFAPAPWDRVVTSAIVGGVIVFTGRMSLARKRQST